MVWNLFYMTRNCKGQFLAGTFCNEYDIDIFKFSKGGTSIMGQSIEYQKLMTEMVYVNLPGPEEAAPGMTGGELLHGFLAELYKTSNPDVKNYVNLLCSKWNVRYREMRG